MIETLITAGYIIGGVGIICSVIGYFIFPKMISAFIQDKTNNKEE
jgi:hypothetical protein